MSSLRRGVLRAVRLLPDAIKIGVETEAALPPKGEEEQLSNGKLGEKLPNETQDTPDGLEANTEEHTGLLQKLSEQLEALQAQLDVAEAEKRELSNKISSLETEAARVKEAFAQKEQELVASVDAERAQARAEAKVQGHAEGLESGRVAAEHQAQSEAEGRYRGKFSNLASALEGVSAKLEAHFTELVALNQPRMLRLWQEMLKRMLQRESILVPESVLDVLSDVLSRLSDKNNILIYVSPEDLEMLQDKMQDEFEDVLRGVKHLELKADANVDKGSCLVETNLGVYDARWRTQLDQIDSAVEKLFQKLGKAPKPEVARSGRSTKKSGADAPETKKTAKTTKTTKTTKATTKKTAELQDA